MKGTRYITGSAALFAFDQILKSHVEETMKQGEEKSLGKNVVLRRVHNKGMCLNLLDHSPAVVEILSLVSTALLSVFQSITLCKKGRNCRKSALMLMAAGAWSNTFDRVRRGYVVDYIGFRCKNERVREITYNAGDFFILAGSLLLVLSAAWGNEKKKPGAYGTAGHTEIR